jgi:uncharacterized protein YlxW (UPF0749 family)
MPNTRHRRAIEDLTREKADLGKQLTNAQAEMEQLQKHVDEFQAAMRDIDEVMSKLNG